MVYEYQSRPPQNSDLLLQWLGLESSSLDYIASRHIRSVAKMDAAFDSSVCFDPAAIGFLPNDSLERSLGRYSVAIAKGYPV